MSAAAAFDGGGFRHEAFLYAGDEEFLATTTSFVRSGLEACEPIMVALRGERIDLLRSALQDDAGSVSFVEMAELGRNPARIIPAWHAFVEEARPRRARGIGEPVWRGRSGDELSECRIHELLLNLAFADGSEWWLLCPYDADRLDGRALELARATHPLLLEDGDSRESDVYRPPGALQAPLDGPLPAPPGRPPRLSFGTGTLTEVRRWVRRHGAEADLSADRASNLVLAAHEVAMNSVRHGGGSGVLRAWRDGGTAIVEVTDAGRIDDPLAGRVRPGRDAGSGRGLWLANHLCDLVQLRSGPSGTVVRLHVRAR
jgi:anti-sigma regulatory factor (Ser/Thr protein kinase)